MYLRSEEEMRQSRYRRQIEEDREQKVKSQRAQENALITARMVGGLLVWLLEIMVIAGVFLWVERNL